MAGTSVSSGNADCITTTTPIESTVTKTIIFINLESVVDKEGKLKYLTQLFDELPEDYHKDLTTLIPYRMSNSK